MGVVPMPRKISVDYRGHSNEQSRRRFPRAAVLSVDTAWSCVSTRCPDTPALLVQESNRRCGPHPPPAYRDSCRRDRDPSCRTGVRRRTPPGTDLTSTCPLSAGDVGYPPGLQDTPPVGRLASCKDGQYV